MLKHTLTENHSKATTKWHISIIITSYIQHRFEFENENVVYIPFFIFSENRNNDRYTDPSSIQFSSRDKEAAGCAYRSWDGSR